MQLKSLTLLLILLLVGLVLTACSQNNRLQSVEANAEVLGIDFAMQLEASGQNPADFLPFNPLTQEVKFTTLSLVESNAPVTDIREASLKTLKAENLYDASHAIDETFIYSHLQHYEAFEKTLGDFYIKAFQIDGVDAGFYYLEINKEVLGLAENDSVTESLIKEKPEGVELLVPYLKESLGGIIPDSKMAEIFAAASRGDDLYHLYGSLFPQEISVKQLNIQNLTDEDKPVLAFTNEQSFAFVPKSYISDLHQDFESFIELDY